MGRKKTRLTTFFHFCRSNVAADSAHGTDNHFVRNKNGYSSVTGR